MNRILLVWNIALSVLLIACILFVWYFWGWVDGFWLVWVERTMDANERIELLEKHIGEINEILESK